MIGYVIGLLLPTVSSLLGYKKTSWILWAGFFSLLLTKPWHEFRGFEGYFEAFVYIFVTVPLYLTGLIVWGTAYAKKRKKREGGH